MPQHCDDAKEEFRSCDVPASGPRGPAAPGPRHALHVLLCFATLGLWLPCYAVLLLLSHLSPSPSSAAIARWEVLAHRSAGPRPPAAERVEEEPATR